MSIFEGITHSEEIQALLNDAHTQYDNAKSRLESQKEDTTEKVHGTLLKVEDIKEGYCWFKAKKVRYHVIPD